MRPWALALAIALAGCKDEKAAAPASPQMDGVRTAVLEAVAALPNMPKSVHFHGVQTYAQAAAKRTAVCGLVSAFADDANIFVPFVSVAKEVSPPDATPARYDFDTHVGTTTAEATRVYNALVTYCWDRGGPAPGQPPALPPLPDNIADPRVPAADPAPAAPKPPPPRGKVAADGTATVRQSANVHAGPSGPSIRTVAQGTSLHVFATAPGGWYEVGDAVPFGWVHESMLNR